MTGIGFEIRRLCVLGESKTPAEISFQKGLNVIVGASDTGKSYVAQCINFMFGGGDAPKKILESEGYEIITLDLKLRANDDVVTLERALKGGNFF